MNKRVISIIMAVCMIFALAVPVAAAGSDIKGHWAEADINNLNSLGIMKGYINGSFKPNNNITKAEFITMLNRTFGLTRTESINYADVPTTKWFYNDIAKAEAFGYMFTFNQKVRPELALTREEAAAMFGKLLGLSSSEPSRFTDSGSISSWALPYVTAVAEAGIINGYLDGSFKPKNTITRAEVARVVCNTVGNYYSTAGTYTDLANQNATIISSGVTLRNMTIPGNLYITEGVGSGTVTLDNVIVKGQVLAVGSPSCNLILNGAATSVDVDSRNIKIQVSSDIKGLAVSGVYSTSQIVINPNASIALLVLNSSANVSGSGKVAKAEINASGVTLAMRPEQWTMRAGIGATIAGNYTVSSGTGGVDFAAGYPTANLITSVYGSASIDVKIKTEKACNVYYIAVLAGSKQPTAAQVKALQSYDGINVVRGNLSAVGGANIEISASLAGLMATTAYDVWFVTEELATGAFGTPVKLTPNTPIFDENYPAVLAANGSSASVSVKVSKNTTVYWAAVPKSSVTIPTVQQITNQSLNVSGTAYGKKSVSTGYVDTLNITGLSLGASAYNLFITTADGNGKFDSTTPVKLDLSSAANSMNVSFSIVPINNEHPIYTTINVDFSKDMYKKNTSMLISFLGGSINSCMKVTAKNVYTGVTTEISNYNVIISNNKNLTIMPPVGGWNSNTVYTVKMEDITTADGQTPTPNSFEFMTSGASSVITAPTSSIQSGNSVSPGSMITLKTPSANAVIQYTIGGGDPKIAPYTTGDGKGVTIQIPTSAVSGVSYIIRAVARVDNSYSTISEFTYMVGYSSAVPQLKNINGLSIPSDTPVLPGTYVYLSCSDQAVTIYYTMDGSTPTINSPSVSASGATPIPINGALGSTVVINAVAIKMINNNLSSSAVVTYKLPISQNASGNAKPNRPLFYYNSSILSDNGYNLPVSRFESIMIASVGGNNVTEIYYTMDGSDPVTSPTRLVSQGQTTTINLSSFNQGETRTFRAVAHNAALGFSSESFSDVASVGLYIQ